MRLIDADAAYDILTAYYHQRTEFQHMALREALDRVPTAEPCKDAISRQAAIDALHMHLMYRMGTDSNKKRLDDWINNLPSAQPERKTGKWIKNSNGTYSCDKCHSWIPNEQHYYANFCLYCGAVMRGEEL